MDQLAMQSLLAAMTTQAAQQGQPQMAGGAQAPQMPGQGAGSGGGQVMDEFQTPGATLGATGVQNVQNPTTAPPQGPMQIGIQNGGFQPPSATNMTPAGQGFGSLEAAQISDRGQQTGLNRFSNYDYRREMDKMALAKEDQFQQRAADDVLAAARKERQTNMNLIGNAFGLDPGDPKAASLARLIEIKAPDDVIEQAMIKMGLSPEAGGAAALKTMGEMNSDLRTKVALTSGAARLINDSLPFMFDEDGSFSWGSGVFGTEANRARLSFRRGVKNALRAVSGAAIPESEIEEEVEKYVPGIGDTDARARAKIEALRSDLGDRIGIYTEGYELDPEYVWSIETPWSPANAAGNIEERTGTPPDEERRQQLLGKY